jgi:hypothetical protein
VIFESENNAEILKGKYKGKGDPRISRAMINLLKVQEGDTILDPFVGSGAFIGDAPTMGLNAIGIEVLNIGKMIAEVKCNLGINIADLRNSIVKLFESMDGMLFKQDIRNELTELKEEIRKNTGNGRVYENISPHLAKIIFLKKGMLTSPPYFDALDYIGNNKVSILILGLDEDLSWQSTKQFYEAKHRDEEKHETLPLFVSDRYLSIQLPPSSLELIKLLQESHRAYKSRVIENYLKMMKLSFEECYRILGNNKYYLMVVSKYHTWTINGREQTIETSSILADLGKSGGFKVADIIEHGLSKADKGKIGVEDILIFQK